MPTPAQVQREATVLAYKHGWLADSRYAFGPSQGSELSSADGAAFVGAYRGLEACLEHTMLASR